MGAKVKMTPVESLDVGRLKVGVFVSKKSSVTSEESSEHNRKNMGI